MASKTSIALTLKCYEQLEHMQHAMRKESTLFCLCVMIYDKMTTNSEYSQTLHGKVLKTLVFRIYIKGPVAGHAFLVCTSHGTFWSHFGWEASYLGINVLKTWVFIIHLKV